MALKMHASEARERAAAAYSKTIEERQRFQREDVLLLRQRGMVPLAIADKVEISLSRVVAYLKEAGETVPGYLTTSNAPPRGECCPTCGRG